jgi:hypothetical protein
MKTKIKKRSKSKSTIKSRIQSAAWPLPYSRVEFSWMSPMSIRTTQ